VSYPSVLGLKAHDFGGFSVSRIYYDAGFSLRYTLEMFQKDTLHHAYFIEGDRASILAEIESFLQAAFKLTRHGNPDVHYAEHDSFGIDEGRALQTMQSMKPVIGEKKVFIVYVNSITSEAQNSLLKVFEEPTPGTHFFVISTSQRILLPTLRSRMVVVTHQSAQKTDMRGEARKFIPMSPKARLEFVAPMLEEKDKAKAEEFLQAIVSELHRTGNMASIKEILLLIRYLKDRSPSLKLVLERIALLEF
jgi:DNA polymerase III delta prime subunit